MTLSDQESVYFVALDANGRTISATGSEEIANEDARSGGRVFKVIAPHVFAARRQALEALTEPQG